jgi:two-component system chemotaxis response regulator CheB
LTIRIAKKGDVLKGGVIYIAPGEQNVRIEKNLDGVPAIGFTSKKYEEFNYPSVNCLFESVAEVYGNKSIGVMLTGMGKDGMNGMKKIYQQGGFTIAQDEESSVVYGMPKAAVESGAVKQTVPLREMAGFIISCL